MTDSKDLSLDDLDDDLRELRCRVDNPQSGFFGPGSTYWKVARENVLALTGPSAILLQIAHPHVAAGVEDHSNFREDPHARLRRTFSYVHRIVFGFADQAIETAQTVRDMHERVRGTLPESVGPFDRGSSYYANRDDLLLWVYATLFDQALVGYNTLVDDLSLEEEESYYQESKIFARLFGVNKSSLPETVDDFYDYYNHEINNTLAVGSQGQQLQRDLFHHNTLLIPLHYFMGGGFLPDRVRELFGISWSPLRESLFEMACGSIKSTVSLLPSYPRYVKKYRYRKYKLQKQSNSKTNGFNRITSPLKLLGM